MVMFAEITKNECVKEGTRVESKNLTNTADNLETVQDRMQVVIIR